MHTLPLTGTFIIVFGIASIMLSVVRPTVPRQCLGQVDRESSGLAPKQAPSDWLHKLGCLARPLIHVSLPKEGWEGSALRVYFVYAGWYSSEVVPIYFDTKTAPAGGIPPVLSPLLVRRFDSNHEAAYLVAPLVGVLFGFYLLSVVLAMGIKRRKCDILEVSSDSFDLITVCVGAGLDLNFAALRVVEDMRDVRPAMAHGYELLTLGLQAGLVRERVLRNFVARTGMEDVSMLVAMLIQAGHFGTGVAESFRVHSDMLCTKRRMLAEEQAAKTGTKVLFPLVFYLFPALCVVLLGPTDIQIMAGLRSAINNQRHPPQEIAVRSLGHPAIRHILANYRPTRPTRVCRMQDAVIVEFSLILLILPLTIFDVAEPGTAPYDKVVTINAVRGTARYDATFTSPVRTNSQVQGVATSYYQNRLAMFDGVANCAVASVIPYAGSGNLFMVTMSYSFTDLAPVRALALFTGSILLSSQTIMLCERAAPVLPVLM